MTDPRPVEGQTLRPPSRRTLLLITVGGFAAAAAITVLFVLPVEFHRDPTGFGRLTGLTRLAGPRPVKVDAPVGAPARFYATPFRSDTIEISLETPDKGPEGSELEYKVRMRAGDSLVYSWTVSGLDRPDEFYYDFHGETPAGPGAPEAKVVEYKQATGLSANGVLIAPMPGVHGWYLQNQSASRVTVRLRLSGFYELIPPGAYGNAAGIRPAPSKP